MEAIVYVYNKKIVYRESKKSLALCSYNRLVFTDRKNYRETRRETHLSRVVRGLGRFVRSPGLTDYTYPS